MKAALSSSLLIALIAVRPISVLAGITVEPWRAIYKGAVYTSGYADTDEVRLHRVHALRVDLWDPAIEFFSTPSNGAIPRETDGQTTTAFANAYGTQLAINANFFSPVSTISGEPRDIDDLAVSQGNIVSPADGTRVRVLISKNNQVTFTGTAPADLSNVWTAVAGSDFILVNGVPQLAACNTSFCGPNPRTAVGLSQNGRYFYMVVIDGRQPGWSDGATLYETGQWLLRLGAWNAVNLDGGGSSAMTMLENGSAVLFNRPSGGVQRVNGNHLGLLTKEIAPQISQAPSSATAIMGSNPSLRVVASGSPPLKYQWARNGVLLAEATNSVHVLSELKPGDAGNYVVVVTNSVGAVTSAPAVIQTHYVLTITNSIGGEVIRSPNQPSLAPGATVSLIPQPDPGFTFVAWKGVGTASTVPLNITMDSHKTVGAEFSGAPPEIILDNTNAALTGMWTTYANLGDAYGPSFYGAAAVAANIVPSHTATYRPLIYTAGRYAIFLWHPTDSSSSSTAPWTVGFDTGTAVMAVDQTKNGGRWKLLFAGKNFPKGTNSLVRLGNNAGASDRVVADAVKLVYGTPPVINKQPADTADLSDFPASLSIEASGSAPLFYQWRLNETALMGATGSNLQISNLNTATTGSYDVVITNLFGSITSSVARVAVGYRLESFASLGGTMTRSPDLVGYPPGSTVILNAISSLTEARFFGWIGDVRATNSSVAVLMTNHITVAAVFTGVMGDSIKEDPSIETWASLRSQNQFELTVASDSRTVCWLESSPDLFNWTTLTNWPNYHGTCSFVLPLLKDQAQSFFRVSAWE